MGRNYQGKHQGYTENRYQVLAEDRQSRLCIFMRALKLNHNCVGVVIMGTEEADDTTTTSTTIGTGMQSTVGEVPTIEFGVGVVLSTTGLDHAR